MPTLIETLAVALRGYSGIVVEAQPADMMVDLPTGNGRRQKVKVWTQQLRGTAGHAVRLQSRAGAVTDAALVRRALQQNANVTLPGFALDARGAEPVLDVVYGLPADGITVAELMDALLRVATAADAAEAEMSGEDRF